ncbi:MAG: peptide deformylase [Acidobacteriia bacterium]|nr:peptide deformylase [Terriglobia bacterium]MBV8905798.1 peptide deformylase [Terriglobia bacterium]
MRLKIVQAGEAVLRSRARELTREELRDAEIRQLIEWMRETMRDAPGVGLAAPQVGLALQLAVIEDPEEGQRAIAPERLAERGRRPVPFHVIVNPSIELTGEPVEFFEGCLSLAGLTALVPRAVAARVRCWNHEGDPITIEADGWYARILQHEIDHLNGTMYVDRMHSRSLMTVEHLTKHWNHLPISEVKQRLGI